LELTRLAPTLIDCWCWRTPPPRMRMSWLPLRSTWLRARQEADSAQRLLSAVKVWLALLPDDAKLELRAPKSTAGAPVKLLGVRRHLPPRRPARSGGFGRPWKAPQRLSLAGFSVAASQALPGALAGSGPALRTPSLRDIFEKQPRRLR
jgi:hypothetical protein